METIRNTKFISFVVMGYMLIALSWWSILLYQKNHQVYQSSVEKLYIEQGNPQAITPEAIELEDKYNRQRIMIMGEGLVFGVMLILGIWLILRSFKKELEVAKRQNNFMLSITHELKSPIASIQLILDTLNKRKLDPATQSELVESAGEENLRLARLVDNILFLNKFDHKQNFYFEKLNISDFFEQLSLQYKSKFKDRMISMDIEKNCFLLFDRLAMEMAIRNIIDNALKYAPKDKEIKLNLKSTDKKIVIEVADQGIGIPDTEKQKVLEKFYRLGSEETRTTTGTGLGLYITKEIIRLHKGKISVENNSPKGTLMKIILAAHE